MASYYKRNGWYWLSFYEGGTRKRVPLFTKDKAIANFKKNEIELKLAKGENPLPDKSLPALEALQDFKKSRSGRIVAKTEQTDNHRLELFIKESGISKLSSINEKRLKEHLDNRIKSDHISHVTANHTIRIVKTFLTWALKNKLINENPIRFMEKYKVNPVEQRFLTQEEANKVLTAAKDNRLYLLVAGAIYTGMRFSELQRLQWQDIDFKEALISVRLSKAEKFRKVPIHGDFAKLLMPYKKTGEVFDTLNFKGEFDKIRKDSKIGYFRFHDLRHTFAALMIKAGVDVYTLSKILGHTTIKITTETYGHLYHDHIQEAMGKLKI